MLIILKTEDAIKDLTDHLQRFMGYNISLEFSVDIEQKQQRSPIFPDFLFEQSNFFHANHTWCRTLGWFLSDLTNNCSKIRSEAIRKFHEKLNKIQLNRKRDLS